MMGNGLSDGLHTAVWLFAYSADILASILTLLFYAGVEQDATRSKRFHAPLLRFVAREGYVVLVFTVTYFIFSQAPSFAMKPIMSAMCNGALIHGLILLALSWPELFRYFAALFEVEKSGSRQSPSGRPIPRAAAAAAGVAFAAAAYVFYASPTSPPPPLRVLVIAAAASVVSAMSVSFVVSAALFVARSTARAPNLRGPALPFAAVSVILYITSIGYEFAPQFIRGEPGSVRRYFFFALFFLFINAFIITVLFPLIAKRLGARRVVHADGGGLSRREAEIAELLADGKAYQEIADELHVSLSTVRTHVAHIYEKLRVRNKVELANLRRGTDKR